MHTSEPTHGRRIATGTRTDPSRADNSPETPVPGAPVRDAGLWAVCPGREGSGECNRRILPLGTLVEKISDFRCVSTRRFQEIVAHLDIDHPSPASVSRMAKDLDDQVQAFLLRPIEQTIPYLFVDASYYKIRAEHDTSPRRFW